MSVHIVDHTPTATELYHVISEKAMRLGELLSKENDRDTLESRYYYTVLGTLLKSLTLLAHENDCNGSMRHTSVELDNLQNVMRQKGVDWIKESYLRSLFRVIHDTTKEGHGLECKKLLYNTSVALQALAVKKCTPLYALLILEDSSAIMKAISDVVSEYLYSNETPNSVLISNSHFGGNANEGEANEQRTGSIQTVTGEHKIDITTIHSIVYMYLKMDSYASSMYTVSRRETDLIFLTDEKRQVQLIVKLCENCEETTGRIELANLKRIYGSQKILMMEWSATDNIFAGSAFI